MLSCSSQEQTFWFIDEVDDRAGDRWPSAGHLEGEDYGEAEGTEQDAPDEGKEGAETEVIDGDLTRVGYCWWLFSTLSLDTFKIESHDAL